MQVIAHYADEGVSGRNADRPKLQEAIGYAKETRAVLIVSGLSRLARNTVDALTIANDLDKAGAGLVMLDLNVDSTTAIGRMIFTVFAALVAFERETIGERTSEALLYMQRNGKRVSRYAPYGWTINGKELVEDPVEQNWIGWMCREYKAGRSYHEIAQGLNARGVLTKEGKSHWSYAQVKRVIVRAQSEREG